MKLATNFENAGAVRAEIADSGICAGTTIMTMDGEVPVELIGPGDRIITRDSGMAVVKEIRQSVSRFQPVRIKAGSLGHTRPDRDMVAAPGVRIHIRDWRAEALFGAPSAFVRAQKLVDGEFLAVQPAQDINTYHLVFDRPHILYADGMEISSDPT